MKKLMLALVAGCMSAAMAGAYAAAGSPADTDKAGRAGPGTAAGEQGAAKPTPGAADKGMKAGAAAGAGTGAAGSASTTTTTTGSTATTGTMDDTGKAKGRRRAARAEKG